MNLAHLLAAIGAGVSRDSICCRAVCSSVWEIVVGTGFRSISAAHERIEASDLPFLELRAVGTGVGRTNFKIGLKFNSVSELSVMANFEICTPDPHRMKILVESFWEGSRISPPKHGFRILLQTRRSRKSTFCSVAYEVLNGINLVIVHA